MKFFTVKRAVAELNQERQVAITMSNRLLTSTSELKKQFKSGNRIDYTRRLSRIIDLSIEMENMNVMTEKDQERAESRLKFEKIFGGLTAIIGSISYAATGGTTEFLVIAAMGGASLGIFIGERFGLKDRFRKAFNKLEQFKNEVLQMERSNQKTLSSTSSQS